jgi:hypothetical protein
MKLQRVPLTSLSISTGDCTSCGLQQKFILNFWKFSITSGTFDGILNHTQGRCPTSGLGTKIQMYGSVTLSERAARYLISTSLRSFELWSTGVERRSRAHSEQPEGLGTSHDVQYNKSCPLHLTRDFLRTRRLKYFWAWSDMQHITLYRISIRYHYGEMTSQCPESFQILSDMQQRV